LSTVTRWVDSALHLTWSRIARRYVERIGTACPRFQ
jgi:hypothetical protein